MELIFDRKDADLLRFLELRNKGYANMTEEERSEWNAGNMKGAYNISDLNRVGEALNYVRDRLTLAGYLMPNVFTAKADWKLTDVPTGVQIAQNISYLAILRAAFTLYATTPPVPAYAGALNLEEANNIEKILFDLDELITKMLAARHFCGEIYSGEV